ncbi:MAG: hypothetical protein AAGK04_08840 [Planctomycetota bacterium]
MDELYATGWSSLDTTGCDFGADGRAFPGVDRVRDEFDRGGCTLTIRHIQLFDCFRAAWQDVNGDPAGAVVGQSEQEAAVYALAQFRRAAVPSA